MTGRRLLTTAVLVTSALAACSGDTAAGCTFELHDSEVDVELFNGMISIDVANGGMTSHQVTSDWASLHVFDNAVVVVAGSQPDLGAGDWVADEFTERCSGTPIAVWTNRYSGEASISFDGGEPIELRSAGQLGGATVAIERLDDSSEPISPDGDTTTDS